MSNLLFRLKLPIWKKQNVFLLFPGPGKSKLEAFSEPFCFFPAREKANWKPEPFCFFPAREKANWKIGSLRPGKKQIGSLNNFAFSR